MTASMTPNATPNAAAAATAGVTAGGGAHEFAEPHYEFMRNGKGAWLVTLTGFREEPGLSPRIVLSPAGGTFERGGGIVVRMQRVAPSAVAGMLADGTRKVLVVETFEDGEPQREYEADLLIAGRDAGIRTS